jgi:hypothetical protein
VVGLTLALQGEGVADVPHRLLRLGQEFVERVLVDRLGLEVDQRGGDGFGAGADQRGRDRVDPGDGGMDAGDALALGLLALGLLAGLAGFLVLDLLVDRILEGHQFGGDARGLGVDQLAALEDRRLEFLALALEGDAQVAQFAARFDGLLHAGAGGDVVLRAGVLLAQGGEAGLGGVVVGDGAGRRREDFGRFGGHGNLGLENEGEQQADDGDAGGDLLDERAALGHRAEFVVDGARPVREERVALFGR